MDGDGNPYMIPILVGIIILLAIALTTILYICRESLVKEFKKKKNIKLNNVSEDDVIEESTDEFDEDDEDEYDDDEEDEFDDDDDEFDDDDEDEFDEDDDDDEFDEDEKEDGDEKK